MKLYSAISANEAWKQLANDLVSFTASEAVDSRLGESQELLHSAVEVSDPSQRWIVSRVPAMNPAFALAEVIWLINGRDDAAFIAHWFPQYPNFVGTAPRQHGAYGKRLRRQGGIDQLERAFLALRNNSQSRQVVLQIWDASYDLPDREGKPRSSDIPCNLMSSLKVRGNRLEWLQIVRSNDIDRGLPHNFIQFTMLQEVIAGWLNVELGSYVHIMDSVHWYPGHSQRMSIDHDVVPSKNSDRFSESFDSSMKAFTSLAARMDGIIKARKCGRIPSYTVIPSLPKPFENMFAIIAADDARRYGQEDVAIEMAARCDNPAIIQLWRRWLERVSRSRKAMAHHSPATATDVPK